jgi:3-mercaptopyruvate sulfurtransferase SseA
MLRKFIAVLFMAIAVNATAATQRAPQPPVRMLVQTDWLATHLSDKNLVILHVGANRAAYDTRAYSRSARFVALSEIASNSQRHPHMNFRQ